jgi:hypothetical protein
MHRIERAGSEMLNILCDAREESEILSFHDEVSGRARRKRTKGEKA